MRNKETPLENDRIELSINGVVKYNYPGYKLEDAIYRANQLSEDYPTSVVTLETVNTHIIMTFGPIKR